MKANLPNGALLLGALVLSMVGATWRGAPAPAGAVLRSAAAPPPGATEVTDARGQAVPVGAYQRIASLNAVADHLLLHLVEPERVVLVTGHSATAHPDAFRFGGRPTAATSAEIEEVLALQPDLVVASIFTDEAWLARLREAGVAVFDLGDMRGASTTLANIDALGALLDQRPRAARLRDRYSLQLRALEDAVPPEAALPGLYVTIYGDAIFGGTTGSSYADLLRLAGVSDVAADAGYVAWPQYSVEQLLSLDPPLVITQQGMASVLCGHSSLGVLAACQPGGRVVEVPGHFDSDPGLGIVHGAHALQRILHPERAPAAAWSPPGEGVAP